MSDGGYLKSRDLGVNFYGPQNGAFYAAKVYRPLSKHKKEIRLARVLPGKANDPIEIQLVQNVRVQSPSEHEMRPDKFLCEAIQQLEQEKPPSLQSMLSLGKNQIPSGTAYLALSYAAGDANDTTPIKVEGHNFIVFQTMSTAIKQFRNAAPKSTTIQMWIDQICIDQSNLEERGHQVAMMADIYRGAEETWIWLGSSEELSGRDKVLGPFFRKVARNFVENMKNLPDFGTHIPSIQDYAEINEELSRKGSKERTGLKQFSESRWWSRCWVYQEATLAQSATFFFGDLAIQRELLCLVYMGLSGTAVGNVLQTPVGESWGRWPSISGMIRRLHFFNVYISVLKDGMMDLPTALTLSRESNCSDTRDKVYGMLGLVRLNYGIVPNYAVSNSVANVFTEATKKIIERHGTLNILARAFRHPRDSAITLPSWVPDFSSKSPLNRPLLPEEQSDPFLANLMIGARAVGSYNPVFLEDCFGNSILHCCILPLGRVANKQDCISKCPTSNEKSQTPEAIGVDLLNSFSEEASRSMQNGGLVGVYQPTGERVKDVLPGCLRLGTLGKHSSPDASVVEGASTYVTTSMAQGDKDDFLSVFVTPHHLLGLAMGGIRADDLLVIFTDASVPFLIRRIDPCVGDQYHDLPQNGNFANYRLVGHAYVHGLDVSRYLQDIYDGTLRSEVRRIHLH